jgi:hypothetical protein
MRAAAPVLGRWWFVAAARRSIDRFAFAPASPAPLAVLRIGLSLVLLGQAVLIAPSYRQLYDGSGLLPGPIQDMLATPGLPHVRGLARLLAPAGIGEASILSMVGGLYVLSLVALGLGLGTRAAAVLSWFLHLTLETTGAGTNYGADWLAHIFLF